MNNTALAILRISSHRQKDGISHETQEKEIREYAKEHEVEVVKFAPILESAKDWERREKYQSLIQWALDNKVRHIIWYMADREARNFTDYERMEKLIRQDRIEIHYVRERKRLHSKSPAFDFSMREIEVWRDKQLSRTISVKTGDAMTAKAEAGWFPQNHAPLGYVHKKLTDDTGKERKRGTIIVPDPNQRNVKLVQRIFELRAAGESMGSIRQKVIYEGLVSPERVKTFHKSYIEKILKNTFYAGRFKWRGKEYEGKHALIIPRATLAKVQGAIYGKRKNIELNEFNLFGHGWMTCAECGCFIVYERKKTRFHYYHCANSKGVHPSLRGLNVSLENLWRQFESLIDQISISPELAEKIAKEFNRNDAQALRVVHQEIQDKQLLLKANEQKEDELYGDFKKGLLDEMAYHRMVKRTRDEKNQLLADIEKAQGVLMSDMSENVESALELASTAKSLWNSRSPFERKEFLEIISSNRRMSGVTVEFTLRKLFKVISEMKKNKEWRPDMDDLRKALILPNTPNIANPKGLVP